MNHDEHLDNILDEALNEYRNAEPLTGLESRVLERLQTSKPTRVGPWLRWSFATVCAAVVALAVWIGMTRRPPQIVTPAAEVAAHPRVVLPSQPTKSSTIASSKSQVQRVRPPLPALATVVHAQSKPAIAEVFPVPVPLNDNERAFAAALNRHPEVLRTAPAADAAPIIAQIEIKPLSTADETPGENQ